MLFGILTSLLFAAKTQLELQKAVIDWAFMFWSMVISTTLSITIAELSKKIQKVPGQRPDELEKPEIEEGHTFGILFGTAWVENPFISWWGDLKSYVIRRHYYKSQWFNQKRIHYEIGYNYALGVHFKLLQGQIDGIKQMRVSDVVVWPTNDDKTSLAADGQTTAAIDHVNAFGGEEKEGGIVGNVNIQYGSSSQAVNDYLAFYVGSDISASRGLLGVILRSVRIGTSPYIKPWKFLCKRTDILTDGTAQWYAAKSEIGSGDMNPVHIIRECMTNTEWGFGHSVGLFDDTVWQDVANDLYTENFGLSRKWEHENESLEDFVKDILRHIDAVLYQEPSTGEFVLKLIRDDYTPAALDTYDDSVISNITGYRREAVGTAPDMIWVKYWNIEDNKSVSIPDHDIALMDQQGGKSVAHHIEYYGITQAALAGKVAARERQSITAFPSPMKIKGDRTMSGIRPGDVFKVDWPILGITGLIVRVLSAKLGTLRDGTVELQCIQDIFSTQTALYSTPPATGWQKPYNDPIAETDRKLMEIPFWDVVQDAGLSNALALDNDAGWLMVMAAQPTGDAYDYELLLRESLTATFYSDGRGLFSANGLLTADLPLNATDATIALSDVQGLYDVEVDTYAIIDDEIVKVKAVNSAVNQVTIARGCLDTVPAAHSGPDSAGSNAARIWFTEMGAYYAGREFAATDQPGVKILPRTPKGQFAEGSATARNADAFNSRMVRPYPPGDFKVDGASYPSSFVYEPTISWVHRDRQQQIAEIVEHNDATIGPEAGTTYTLTIYDQSDILLRTVTGLTGLTYTYDSLDERLDGGLGSGDALNTQLRFVLKSVRDGYDSWQSYDVTVARA